MSAAQNEVQQLRDIDEITLDFDVAQATVKSLCELLWCHDRYNAPIEIEFSDVGRSGHAAVERMVKAFQEIQEFYDEEKKGRAQS